MKYIIFDDGSKQPIEKEGFYCIETAVVIDKDVVLTDKWIVTGWQNKNKMSGIDEIDYENSIEKIFNHKPTDDELLHFAISNGLSIYDYVQVEELKQINRL